MKYIEISTRDNGALVGQHATDVAMGDHTVGLEKRFRGMVICRFESRPRPLSAVPCALVSDVAYVVRIETLRSAPRNIDGSTRARTVLALPDGINPPGDQSDQEDALRDPLRNRTHAALRRLPSLGLVPTTIRGKEAIDLGVRHQTCQSGEAAVGLQRLRRAHEAGPCSQCQRAADADPAHTERRDVFDTQADVPDHEKVERLRGNRLDERLDFGGVLWTRGEEHIRPRRRVRLQAPY